MSANPGRQREQRKLIAAITVAVLILWPLVAATTKYTLEEVALLMPVVVVLIGVAAGVVVFWLRVVRERRTHGRR